MVSRDAVVKALGRILTLLPVVPFHVFKRDSSGLDALSYDRVVNLLMSQPKSFLRPDDFVYIIAESPGNANENLLKAPYDQLGKEDNNPVDDLFQQTQQP